jgi:thiosulfate/3-mercaptopyruvate sulfurtransferase
MSDVLVTPSWLSEHLSAVVCLDGTWWMPAEGRNGAAEFLTRHIPGARFFDINACADRSTDLPHMLPSNEVFAAEMERLGVSSDTTVVVYDVPGMFTAARLWYTFRVFGHAAEKIKILSGGLEAWMKEGLPTESGEPHIVPAAAGSYRACLNHAGVRCADDVANHRDVDQFLDARSAGRFNGTEPEPRPNMRSGHAPGSLCVPWKRLLVANGAAFPYVMRPAEELREVFTDAGADFGKHTTCACGSGVTSCVLILGLHLVGMGLEQLAMHDGSWAEYGQVGAPWPVVC